jgi:hypothetical protein
MKTLRRFSRNRYFSHARITAAVILMSAAAAMLFMSVSPPASAQPTARTHPLTPKFSAAVAFDVSPALRDLVPSPKRFAASSTVLEVRPERGPKTRSEGYSGDAALQPLSPAIAIPSPLVNFEGLSNQDNFNIFGFRVNPPDPNGEVGRNHYVEIINLVFAVYDKSGNKLLGPVDTGTLWSGFAVPDCTDPSGDPIVLYDQFADRWLLSQFTTRGFNPSGNFNGKPFYNCVAISQTGDPTGAYFRYAFITSGADSEPFFPDYPKYGVWGNSYLLTSRDFGRKNAYGISVYALEKERMVAGDPNARMVHFFLDSAVPGVLPQIGDGLLPADIDGANADDRVPAPIVGTQDDGGPYGATFDALNVYDLSVNWKKLSTASLKLAAQLPVAPFDSIFPCAPGSRDCLPQPGITNPDQYLDILSYRQRPTFRLAYRNFGQYEALVTNQSVEAAPGVAGVRWYEIRRTKGVYSLFQQGTFAPGDGVHRWMGSVAMDRQSNMALGYSVVNGTNVFPGIRYTGRLSGDLLGQMTLGEGVIINGSGVQTTTNSRWGDYTDMTIDPTDDCTFWYVNEYYTAVGQASSLAGWQTRIASFKLPGCQ